MAIDMTTVKQIMHNNKEVAKIEDGLGNTLWQKAAPKGYYIKDGKYYINRGSGQLWDNSTTPSTIWQIENDNRIYCLDGDTKRYIQYPTEDQYDHYDARNNPTLITEKYDWCYKNGNYITGTIKGNTYYFRRKTPTGCTMENTVKTLTFEPVY